MSWKKLITGLWFKLKKDKVKFVKSTVSGFNLMTIEGTVRNSADQDDAWFYYLSLNHNIIFDIGANVGYTAILAMLQDPNRKYLLVDPNPKALARASMNLISNNFGTKAFYYSAFVSDKNEKDIKFYTVGVGAAGSMHPTHAKTASSINSYYNVKTVTLDYLYSFYKIKPDLIKIDVEGAETFVMDGAYTIAKETNCSFLIEMHDVKGISMKAGGDKMLEWCKELGYKAWYLKEGKELVTSETIKNRGKCHLLLMPKTKDYPDYLIGIKQNAPLPILVK